MLALQQAYEVKVSVIEYLKATYTIQNMGVKNTWITKCDRVEDYRRAWAFFEEKFKVK